MSDASPAFNKLVPGFDFLQGLVKSAGAALPSIGQWVAPTLNPEELEKRIEELRTVQFWLEQNARMLGATIQALEVQRMTLSTLKTMNVPLAELRDALKVRPAAPAEAAAPPARKAAARRSTKAGSPAAAAAAAAGAIDPMQWWGALTKQFTQLAATALKDSAGDAAKQLAGAMVKQSFEAAEQTLKTAVATPGKVAGVVAKAASSAAKTAARTAGGAAATRARKAARPKR